MYEFESDAAVMHVPSLIEKKREGDELSKEEIGFLVEGFTRGSIPDYQVSALAMAIFFRGMSAAETGHLTEAMLHSGEVLDYSLSAPAVVDKHSTGGIGDKVSLVLAPLLACDDVWVPMISGRGLGITGGTLDKLESIPGFKVDLPRERCLAQLEKIGVFMVGQNEDLCPADKKLYALRDVTGTVPSRPLIVASIMCKKLAESVDRLVLDVKYGSGAFMKSHDEAELLADDLRKVGKQMGVTTSALLTPMEEPLGHTVGNALEVVEALETLRGNGPDDLEQLTLDLAEKVSNASRRQLAEWLKDGTAHGKFLQLTEAQGGDVDALDKLLEIHRAPVIREVKAAASGRVAVVSAGCIGESCVALGAGRAKAEDEIDHAVGIDRLLKVGREVVAGETLFRIHAASEESLEEAAPRLEAAVQVE